MKSLFTVSALAATALLTSICGAAEAINITITNPSFEADATSGPGTANFASPSGFSSLGGLTGTFEPGASFDTALPNGIKVAFLQPGTSLTQTFTDVFLADTVYNFTAFVGNRNDQFGTFAYEIDILDVNGFSINQATTTPIPGNGLFVSSTATFDTGANTAFNGQTFGIRLNNTGSEQVTFDDLSFTATTVPFDFSPNLAIGVLGAAWAAKKFLAKKAA